MMLLWLTLGCQQRDPYIPPTDTAQDEADTDTDTDTDADADADADTDTDTDTDTSGTDCSEPWSAQSTHAEQSAWMAACVMDDMAEIFRAFDAARFSTFGCESCHGEDLGGGTYHMPGLSAFDPQDEAWGPFMRDEVRPLMAEQLGYDEYDPENNPDGFGCDGCHSRK